MQVPRDRTHRSPGRGFTADSASRGKASGGTEGRFPLLQLRHRPRSSPVAQQRRSSATGWYSGGPAHRSESAGRVVSAATFPTVGSRFRIRIYSLTLDEVPQERLNGCQARSDGCEHWRQTLELADLLCNRRERLGLFAQDVVQPAINGAWGHLLATLVDALGVGRPLKFARGCLDHLHRDSREIVGVSAGQCRIAQGVDQARGTPGVLVDDGKRPRQEKHTVSRPGGAQPKQDVLTDLLFAQWGDVIAQLHTLNQLLHVWMVKDFVELRLPDEDHVEDLFLAGFQPCEHAYFLEHLRAEIMRVIDDQHDLLALHELLQ